MAITPIKPVELMQGNFQDFIGVWENHVPKFVCDKAINHINKTLDDYSNNQNLIGNDLYIMEGETQFKQKNL